MNCIEQLNEQCRVDDQFWLNSFIVEFEELPEEQKFNFNWYEKDKHILIYCRQSCTYKILEGVVNFII